VDLGDRSYDITIEKGLVSRFGEFIKPFYKAGEVLAVITDENVYELHGSALLESFQNAGLGDFELIVLPAGETTKSFSYLEHIMDSFAEMGLSRKGLVVAFGGGVIGDLTGFASSIWMRGVDYVQIPTTLLSTVDSSVGGKTAIDIESGKNLVGSFYQPRAVLIDTALLKTLPTREYGSGMAEVIKYGVLYDRNLFEQLFEKLPPEDMGEVIYECCRMKAEIVKNDELDNGERIKLNLGHTFGHAIEAKYGFKKYNHGEAVAAGMMICAKFGEKIGLTKAGTYEHLRTLLHEYEIDFIEEYSGLVDAMGRDKKSSGDGVSLVLIREIGDVFVRHMSFAEINDVLIALELNDNGKNATDLDKTLDFQHATDLAKTIDSNVKSSTDIATMIPKIIDEFPHGVITPPPSKSISHRAVICSRLAGGGRIDNLGDSDDIIATNAAIAEILRIEVDDEGNFKIPDHKIIDCNESGSTIRFLLPIAAALGGSYEFIGRGRLLYRPQDAYRRIFEQQGLTFDHTEERIKIDGRLQAGTFALEGDVSSQFITGLLFALPLLDGDSEIVITTPLESAAYVDLTLDVLKAFGIEVQVNYDGDSNAANVIGYSVPGYQTYRPTDYSVEADFSQTAFFLVAAALGCDIELKGLNLDSKQGDKAAIDIIREMGGTIEQDCGGLLSVQGGEHMHGVTIDAREIPDIIPPLSVLCSFVDGESRIINASRLRIKECDRLSAMVSELSKIGIDIEEGDDYMIIRGQKSAPGGVTVDAHGDHRIAMAMSVAAYRCDAPISIRGWQSISKSYPTFYEDFSKVRR
jgi:3-phosphoshikimate 1-carboxyvinyltransferase